MPSTVRWHPLASTTELGIRICSERTEAGATWLGSIEAWLGRFTHLGQNGGLSGSSIDPRVSGMSAMRSQRPAANELYCTWSAVNIDGAAPQLVLNALAGMGLPGAAQDVEVLAAFPEPGPAQRGSIEAIHTPTPFRYSNEVEGRSLVVSIEFSVESTMAHRDAIERTWLAWIDCCAAGAFADEECPVERCVALVSDDNIMSSPTSMRLYCDRLLSGRAALACLVNVLAGLHDRVVALDEVILS